jgi:hypothetical protein
MRHYILTPSSRGPDYPLDANRRRLAILRGVTARSLASQEGDWTWIVYVDPDDPLREERLDAFRSAGRPVIPVHGSPVPAMQWDEPVLTTRIDDDDAFSRDAFRRIYRCVETLSRFDRAVLMLPRGFRVNGSLSVPVVNYRNAWSSLYAPTGDVAHIRMVQHRRVHELAPVRVIDTAPAYLWVRHPDTLTPFRSARDPLNSRVRDLYDVDWPLIESVAA